MMNLVLFLKCFGLVASLIGGSHFFSIGDSGDINRLFAVVLAIVGSVCLYSMFPPRNRS